MSDGVLTQCSCGHEMVVDPSLLGKEGICSACGTGYVLWPKHVEEPQGARDWYLKVDGHEMGPFAAADLRRFEQQGNILPSTLVRKGAEGDWVPAQYVRGLLGTAPAAPATPASRGPGTPPPPPAPPPRRRSTTSAPSPGPRPARGVRAPGQVVARTPSTKRSAGARPRGDSLSASLARHPGFLLGAIGVVVALVVVVAVMATNRDAPADPSTPVAEGTGTSTTRTPVEPIGTVPSGTAPTGNVPSRPAEPTSADAPSPEDDEFAGGDAAEPGYERSAGGMTIPKTGPLSTEQIVAVAAPAVALIQGHKGSGTGFLIRKNLMLTNKHVIDGELMRHVRVVFPDAPDDLRGMYAATLLYEDPDRDLALLEVGIAIRPLDVVSDHTFRRGQEILVIGNPGMGGGQVLRNAVSRGVLSSKFTDDDGQIYHQIGASVNPGNSGGPVLDERGRAIGVVTKKATMQEGIAFCIPADDVLAMLSDADATSQHEAEVMRADHRLRAVALAVTDVSGVYAIALNLYITALQAAASAGEDINKALSRTRAIVEADIHALDQRLVSELTGDAALVSKDEYVSLPTRERFQRLWDNYLQLKSYVENPRGTIETYTQKGIDLRRIRREVLDQIRTVDGLELEAD